MLKINPVARPDCGSIISRIEKLGKVPTSSKIEPPISVSEHNLLGTIAIPKDLRNLENVLPESQYDNHKLLKRNNSSSRHYLPEDSKPNKSSK